MAKNVEEINDAQFQDEVLGSELPVLVDFWAPWCGPCRMLAPVVEQVADTLLGKIKVVKMNVDENPEVAGTYGIHSIPTLIWFKGGQKVEQVVGFSDEVSLKSKCLGVIG